MASFHETPPGKYAEHSCPFIYLTSNAAKCNTQRQHSFKETSTCLREEAPETPEDKEVTELLSVAAFLGASWALNAGTKELSEVNSSGDTGKARGSHGSQLKSMAFVTGVRDGQSEGFDQTWPSQVPPVQLI